MREIQMVDLRRQTEKIRKELNRAIDSVLTDCLFIKGPEVKDFEEALAAYHGVEHCISCANGTDALQIAMMALDLKPGDEVILPAFTYVATAEVMALLGLHPVMVDVDPDHFNIDMVAARQAVTEKTRAIVPVHLFGQISKMDEIMGLAEQHNLFVIEDNAQAIGADYSTPDGQKMKSGTMGHIGSTSFFPSKNLGCFGDGGALFSSDEKLADKMRMVANHGQEKKYYHEIVGINSRLDTLQAAILHVKLKYLDSYIAARQDVAKFYDEKLAGIEELVLPARVSWSSHVFHQYTLRVKNGKRDELKSWLQSRGIPSMIYYPVPLYKQNAYKKYWQKAAELPVTESLCNEVLSLPIHTEMDEEQLKYIRSCVLEFFEG